MMTIAMLILFGGGVILLVVFLRWLFKGPCHNPWNDWGGEL